MTTPSSNIVLILLCALGAMLIFASLLLGPVEIGAGVALQAIVSGDQSAAGAIIREIRLPRALAAWFAGACLGAAGAALQGLLRNPLADPGVLGVSAAAALGAVVAIYFNLSVIGFWATPTSAIVFASAATGAIYLLGAGHVSTARLILIGVGLASFCGALISLAMNLAPNPFALSDLINWLFGSVANRSFRDLSFVAPFAAVGAFLIYLSSSGLRALTLGEETAESLGANIKMTRIYVIAGSAALVGSSVALAGAIGFVGIVAPHLVRPLCVHDPAKIIAPSAALGGAMLVLADLFIRLLPFDQELKLGVAAALIGAPGFVWVAATTKRIAT